MIPRFKKATLNYAKARRKLRKAKKVSYQKTMFGAMSSRQKCVYNDVIIAPSVGIGSISKYWLRCNGMFDVDFQTGGHQPHYFDQAMTFYDHFSVISTTITIQGEQNVNNVAMIVALTTQDTTNAYTSYIDVMEDKHSNWVYVPSGNASSSFKWKLTHKFSSSKFFGKPIKGIVNDYAFRGSAAQDPIEQAYFLISAFPVDTGVSLGAIPMALDMSYYAEFNEPKPILQS